MTVLIVTIRALDDDDVFHQVRAQTGVGIRFLYPVRPLL